MLCSLPFLRQARNKGKYISAQFLQFVTAISLKNAFPNTVGATKQWSLNVETSLFNYSLLNLAIRNSLRDIRTCQEVHQNKLYQVGMKKRVNQLSISRISQ
ncbi:DUF4372 domain-containing protein [Autumnicola psychrophila]|uniref:DUF4372 domain-containing protein n=1 Tax=Autumnicola psychrophila TaxID=3075592 RepID=UPI003D77CC19